MNEKQMARWAKIRKMGRSKFIWIRCVLSWGLLTAFIVVLCTAILDGFDSISVPGIIVYVIAFPIGGYFMGVWCWESGERKFRETEGQKEL
jgi:hypothetical protein